jgi:NAD(P)-dependent dehydrogenase (short-subunit alcohol dehydrogenase family)
MTDSKKTVLITGSTRSIGLALAEHYTKNGWNVIGTTRANSNTDQVRSASALLNLSVLMAAPSTSSWRSRPSSRS